VAFATALVLVAHVLATTARAAPTDPTAARTNPAAQIDAFTGDAVEQGVLSGARAARLRDDWRTVRLGDLPREAGLEEALIARSVARGDLTADEGAALAQLAGKRHLADFAPVPQETAPDPTNWVETVMTWLPRLGGGALAIGVLWWIGSALAQRARVTRAIASGVTAGLLWLGAHAFYSAERSAVAAALVIAGCVASYVAAHLTLVERRRPVSVARMGACMAALWGLLACVLTSPPAAYASALAFGVALGVDDDAPAWAHRHDARVRLRGVGAGLVLLAVGFGLRVAHVRGARVLVHPLWVVGVCTMFTGSALGWDWRVLEGGTRYGTMALAAAVVALGVEGGHGVFVAAGGIAFAAAALVTLIEMIPKRVPLSATLVVVGTVMIGVTFLLDANWPVVVRYVSMES
jgi:hypothetical protein